jgi:hypothetical protein
MQPETGTSGDTVAIRRRRQILYACLAAAVLLVAAFTLPALLKSEPKPAAPVKLVRPVIVERVKLKPVGDERGRGLAELLRRGTAQSVRVLAARLTPVGRNQVYRLYLSGGPAPERLLGGEAVGPEGIFVGEAAVPLAEVRRHRVIELRRVTTSTRVRSEVILRGAIAR